MDDIFEEEKSNKPRKKIKKDLSKSEAFGKKINSVRKSSEVDVPDYLDDFLQHSRGAIFITGNGNNLNQPIIKKKKIIKKIIKKKKVVKPVNNNVIINNKIKIEEEEKKKNEERAKRDKEKKEREEKEKREKEEKEKKEREEKELRERKLKEEKLLKVKNKLIITRKLKKRKKENEYSDSPINMKQSSGSKSESINYNISSENDSINNNNYINNKIVENSNETPSRTKSNYSNEDTDEKYNISSSENSERKEISEEESEITEKRSQKKRVSINSNDISNKNDEESKEEESEEEEEKIEYQKKKKKKIIKRNLKERLEKFKYEEKLKIFIKFSKLLQVKLLTEIRNILKVLLIYKKIKDYQNNCATKICNAFKSYIMRKKFKFNYLIKKILLKREENAFKITSFYKTFVARIQTKQLLKKTKNHYVIYSSLINNKMLYFKYNIEENLHFDYSPLLKSFVSFINKPEKIAKKLIEGYFYNEHYNKLIDPIYETNNNGENIINFQKIFKKADLVSEKNERIAERYIKLHRPIKRERIDDYEERKRKAFDDDNLSKSHKFKEKKLNNIGQMSRSKSFYKLKPKKGILKPSRSYINLRSEEKKIHFGNARIKKYHNSKK